MSTVSDQYIGCVILDPTSIAKYPVQLDEISGDLKPLYSAICRRIINDEPVDLVNLCMSLKGESWWPGSDRVSDMPKMAVTASHAGVYARKLIESRRKIALKEWYVRAENIVESDSVAVAVSKLGGGLASMLEHDPKPPFESFEAVGNEYLKEGGRDNSIKTGNSFIDKRWYLDRGGLHVVAARTGVGKTSFLCWVTAQLLQSGNTVLMFSVEQNKEQITGKFLNGWAKGVPDNYDMAFEVHKSKPLYINDTPGMTIESMMLIANLASRQFKLDAIVVDYMQMIRSEQRFRGNHELVSHVSLMLKEMARRNNCPVISAAQVNRGPEDRADKRPELSDLRGSGTIEQDADSVIMLYRDEYYKQDTEGEDKWLTEVTIKKQRQRDRAQMECTWNRETGQWDDWRKLVKIERNKNKRKLSEKFKDKLSRKDIFE